jgi:hypothetical protein
MNSSRQVRAILAVHAFLTLASSSATAMDSAQGGLAGDYLKRLSLKDLGNIEVTVASKEPETLRRVPAARVSRKS